MFSNDNRISLPIPQNSKRVYTVWVNSSSADARGEADNLYIGRELSTNDLVYTLLNPITSDTGFFNVKVVSFQLGQHKDLDGFSASNVYSGPGLQIRCNFNSPYTQEIISTGVSSMSGVNRDSDTYLNQSLIPIGMININTPNAYSQSWGVPAGGSLLENPASGDPRMPTNICCVCDDMITTITNPNNLKLRIQLASIRTREQTGPILFTDYRPFTTDLFERVVEVPPVFDNRLRDVATDEPFNLPYMICLEFTEV